MTLREAFAISNNKYAENMKNARLGNFCLLYTSSIEIDEIVIDHIIENTNGFIYMQYYPLQSTQYVLRLPQTCEWCKRIYKFSSK